MIIKAMREKCQICKRPAKHFRTDEIHKNEKGVARFSEEQHKNKECDCEITLKDFKRCGYHKNIKI